jgi:hypothetical protein
VTGSRVPGANASGWNNSDVTVSFSCTDALSGVATCASPTTVSGEGENQTVTGAATDRAGNAGSGKVEAISIDRTAPNIDVSTAPPANGAGWNNTDVTATFTCTDALSGVAAGSCPAPQVYASDGQFSASGSVEDRAGNGATRSSSVNVDKTPPTIDGVRAPAANVSGWNAGPVTVSFGCTDALSGIASCASSKVLAGEGAGQSAAGSATDVAGSSASTTVGNINIDLTPPTITGAVSPPGNFAGWNNQPVAVHFTCADALSGIDGCTPDLLLAMEGQYTVMGAATDRAGNITPGALPFPVSIDLTPPVVTVPSSPVVAEATGAAGAAVAFTAAASDLPSGYLPGSLTCMTAGGLVLSGALFPLGDTSVTCAALDLAGNAGAASFLVQVRDTTAPVLSAMSDVVAEATSASGAVVTFDLPTATDLVDGALTATCDHASGATYPVGVTAVGCLAFDQQGNAATTSFQITVRAAKPLTIGKVPGTNDQNELVVFATTVHGATVKYLLPVATDGAGKAVPVTCTPAPGTAFAVGKTTVTCSASDGAGNSAKTTFTVWMQFQVVTDAAYGNMFRQPINPDGSSIFKLGSPIPVKFRLGGASAGIKNLVAYISVVKTSDAIEGTYSETICVVSASSGDKFHYDSTDKEYYFNLSTKNLLKGTYRITAALTDGNAQKVSDGVAHTVRVSLRK